MVLSSFFQQRWGGGRTGPKTREHLLLRYCVIRYWTLNCMMLLGVVSRQMFLSWVSKVLLRLLLTLLCAITSKSDSWQRDCWYYSKSNYFKPNMFMSILSSLDPSPCPGLNLLGSSWYLVPFVLIVRESQFGFGPRWILRRWQGHVLATPLKLINSNCFRKWLQLWKPV